MEGIPSIANVLGEDKVQTILEGKKIRTILKIMRSFTEKYGIENEFDKLKPADAIKKMQDLICAEAYPERIKKQQ